MTTHTVVWIDHHEARVFDLHHDPQDRLPHETVNERTIAATQHEAHRHPLRRSGEATDHPEDRKHFFEQIRSSLYRSPAILIVGPGSAKHELMAFLKKESPQLAALVVGVETTDHPSDPQIVALANKAFLKTDRMGA